MYNEYNYGLGGVFATNCMKCGKELKAEGVFCPGCLADMEKYPVKPNITVHLPVRRTAPTLRKKVRRQKYVKAEDQIRHLKQVRKRLWIALLTVILLFAGTVAVFFHLWDADDGVDIGQNYSSTE